MSFLAGKAYYRFSQALGILLLPCIVSLLFLLKIEEKIKVRGVVESSTQITVTSQLKDTVVKHIAKQVGDRVQSGEVIIEFEDLQGFRSQAAQLKVKLQEQQNRLVRLKPLSKTGSISARDLKKLEFNIAQLQLNYNDLLEKAARLRVKSPIAGRIVTISIKPFQKATIGQELFAVSGGGNKIIECNVPERHYTYLEIGQRVDLKSELYNYLTYDIYHGKVTEISPYGFKQGADVFYEVTINLTDGNRKLKVGSAADCEIITRKAPLIRLLFPRK